jgi:hypothetical protein
MHIEIKGAARFYRNIVEMRSTNYEWPGRIGEPAWTSSPGRLEDAAIQGEACAVAEQRPGCAANGISSMRSEADAIFGGEVKTQRVKG